MWLFHAIILLGSAAAENPNAGTSELFENPPVFELVLLGVGLLLTIALLIFFIVVIARGEASDSTTDDASGESSHDQNAQ